jgi:hypothetical protein
VGDTNQTEPNITTGALAAELGVPVWRVRRAVDALAVQCPRAGLYRLIPRTLIPAIQALLEKRRAEEAACAQ